MRVLIITVSLLLGSSSVFAKECRLFLKKSYLQDSIGELDIKDANDPGVMKYAKFEKKLDFLPEKASWHIPFQGNCGDIKVSSVKVYREFGKRNLKARRFKWEKKPFLSQKSELALKKNQLVLREFKLIELYDRSPASMHVWKLKMVLKYKDKNGKEKEASKVFENPLQR